jgi:aspartyl/glutamyl-tRNA(Asn/Gln) amidotransferase C subunit
MRFMQIIEMKTARRDEVQAMIDEWRTTTAGRRTAQRALTGRDRGEDDVYIVVVEFPSYEAAMTNSDLPETRELAERLAKLCDAPPTYRNLDIIRQDDLSARPSRAVLTAGAPSGLPYDAHMAGRISRTDVLHVARLARLELTDEELDRYVDQLGAVLDHAADVAALDTSGVPPTAHPLPMENVLRDDVVGPSLDRGEVLREAPDSDGTKFRVPRILGEEP